MVVSGLNLLCRWPERGNRSWRLPCCIAGGVGAVGDVSKRPETLIDGSAPRTVDLPRRCGEGHRRAGLTTGQPGRDPEAQGCFARHGEPGQCLGMASRVVSAAVAGLPLFPGDGYVTLRGADADRASRFRARSTRNMAKNRLREASIDTDVLPGDITR